MRYQSHKSYRWNYDHAPPWNEAAQQQLKTSAERLAARQPTSHYAGISVRSPVAIAAGPLLNGQWCLHYAAKGFEVVTYKTVRSVARECYPPPNLVPVKVNGGSVADPSLSETVVACNEMQGSWAVSFGMPSQPPQVWQRDIAWTRDQLPATHLLAVSVVGSVDAAGELDSLAKDYARCARWAASSGADIVEVNFSCPNVCSPDGQLFQVPAQAQRVAQTVADELAQTGFSIPLLAKIGYQSNEECLGQLIDALAGIVSGCVMTNSLPAQVADERGQLLFGGQRRGICGQATLLAAADQIAQFTRLQSRSAASMAAIGVGGITRAADVRNFQEQGAESVQVATSAMIHEDIGRRLELLGASA